MSDDRGFLLAEALLLFIICTIIASLLYAALYSKHAYTLRTQTYYEEFTLYEKQVR